MEGKRGYEALSRGESERRGLLHVIDVDGQDREYNGEGGMRNNPLSPFEYENRPVRDRIWGFTLVFLYVIGVVGAIISLQNVNPLFFKLSKTYLNDPEHCPYDANNDENRRRMLEDDYPELDLEEFFATASSWLVVSMGCSLLFGILFIRLIKDHSMLLARFTIGFQLAIPAVVSGFSFAAGNIGQGLLFLGLSGLTYVVFYLWRREIGVASNLLSVSGHALAGNSVGLITMTILVNLLAVVLLVPMLFGMGASFAVGDVVPNPMRMGSQACVDEAGDAVLCCAWQPRALPALHIILCVVTALWSLFTMRQIQVYVISGVVAQWYFAPTGTPVAGNLRRSLKHAFTSSFGTNAFAGLVITFTNMVKQSAQNEQENGHGSIFGFLASCFAGILEYLTKFATVFAAITGEALLTAGRTVTDLLARNLLDAFATTIWFPSALLTLVSITMAGLWGAGAGALYRYVHKDAQEHHHMDNSILFAVLAGIMALVVLNFLAGLLLSILDSVFVCFALDQDRHEIANAELHEALLHVAHERGILVEEPDGNLEYGNAALRHEHGPSVSKQ